jgi:hypothetical protein
MIAALFAGAVIGAAPAKAPTAPKRDAFLKTARKQILTGEYAQGIAGLESVYAGAPEPELLLEIADAYDEWGDHCTAALDAFQRFFAACGSCGVLDKANNDFVLAQNRCASDITFESDPKGAIVRIETDDWSRVTPFTTRMKPGRYAYEVHLSGHLTKKDALAVAAGAPMTVQVRLERDPGPRDTVPSITSARSALPTPEPPAKPIPVGTWLVLGASVAAGAAGIVLLAEGIHDRDRGFALKGMPSSDPSAIADLDSHASRDYAFAAIGFGLSLAGLALSAVLGAID